MTEVVPKTVADAITWLRCERRCNMLDHATVVGIMGAEREQSVADWIEGNRATYFHCITHGYIAEEPVEEEVAFAHEAVAEAIVEPELNTPVDEVDDKGDDSSFGKQRDVTSGSVDGDSDDDEYEYVYEDD